MNAFGLESAAAAPVARAAARAAKSPRARVRDRVAGLENGLAVIGAFDHDRPRLTVSEVAARCGLTRAAARRYLLTLQHLGFVDADRRGSVQAYALTPKVLRLSQSYLHSARLPRLLLPEVQRVAYALKEASSAGVLEGSDVLCVAALSVGRLVSSTLQPGTRVPAYCTANGRVLLAALPLPALDDWFAEQLHARPDGLLPALTPRTQVQPGRLRTELARVRTQGYAAVDQELEAGLRTVAVPLVDQHGVAVAALNASAHAARLSMDRLVDDCLPTLREAQAQLRPLL